MTDSHDPLDELASAHLDGDTGPQEAARIAVDPDLAERLAAFGRVREQLRGEGPQIDDLQRERAIAAALDAFDEAGAAASSAHVPVAAVPLVSRSRTLRTMRWVGVAAAIALLALAVPFLDRLDSGSNDQAATGLDATSEDASGGAATMRDTEDSASADALVAAPGGELVDLGSFSGTADLADSVRAQLAARSAAMQTTTAPAVETSGGESAPLCEAEKKSLGGAIAYSALATLDDQAVLVVVRDDAEGGQTMLVLDRASCETLSAGKL
ncbi:MAG: hypothetical protein ACOYXM_11190 [Actinomycetota bacterium]